MRIVFFGDFCFGMRYPNGVVEVGYGLVKVKIVLRGSELCVMLRLGKGVVKIRLSKDLVKSIFLRRPSPVYPLCRVSIPLNIKLTQELGAGSWKFTEP